MVPRSQKKKKRGGGGGCWSTCGTELLKSEKQSVKEGTGFVFRPVKTSYPKGMPSAYWLVFNPMWGLQLPQGHSVQVHITACALQTM